MGNKKNRRNRKARQQKGRGASQVQLALGLGLVALAAVAVIVVINLSSTGTDESALPESIDGRYAGIPRGTDARGLPRLGDPDAPVVIEEISDFT